MTPTASLLRRAYGPVASASTWKTSLKTCFDIPWMTLTALLVVGPGVAGATLILVVPLSILLVSMAMTVNRGAARLDRVALEEFLDLRIVGNHRPPPPPPEGRSGWGIRRLWHFHFSQLTDPAMWRTVAYRLVSLPVTVVSALAVTIAWSLPLTFLTSPLWISQLPDHRLGSLPRPLLALLGVGLGAALLILTPRVVDLVGRLLRRTARLLGRPADEALADRLQEVEDSRARVVDAAEAERRRIERDLHDGAQQRLVALAMNLGMAKERYDRDPEGTKALIDEAHAEAKRAMVELRDLARGVHPAVLTDRGLGPALSAVAARSAVPITVDVDSLGRLDEATEGIAYFVACEALANVAKHSGASAARVVIGRRGDRLVLEVTDDGTGGADPDGEGLRGLRDRVEGVDGWFHVASPPGGPTTILAELPCES